MEYFCGIFNKWELFKNIPEWSNRCKEKSLCKATVHPHSFTYGC